MLRCLLFLILLAWLGVASAAAAAPTPPTSTPTPSVQASAQQVLVLLRLPPQHFRTGPSYGGDYGEGTARAARRRIATRIAHAHGLSLVTSWPMPLLGLDCFVLGVPANRSPAEVAVALSKERAVVWSEPMHVYQAQSSAEAPNDPLYRLQPAAQQWRLAELHAVATGRNVRVAVVDSAVDPTHPDLAGQLQTRQSFVTGPAASAETHGTGVAGVIAAVEGNRLGMAGVAPGARLMALRACWQKDGGTVCDTLSLAKAMHYAIENGAQVVNMSLAGPPDMLLGRLIDTAVTRGVVVVASVDPSLVGGGFPASHPGVVPVAVDGAGESVGVEAPGRDIPTTQPGGRWSFVNGSSYSAAHVSGLFALMRERRPRGRLVVQRVGSKVDPCASLLRSEAACGAMRHAAGEAAPVR